MNNNYRTIALISHASKVRQIYKYLSSIKNLCSMLHGSLDGSGVRGRMDTCVWMAESLLCSPETTTTLLIG